jgi:mRNA interferase MazF
VTKFRQGDVVLALFPFSSLEGAKARPCVILAQCAVPEDYVVAYISSSEFASKLSTSVRIERAAKVNEDTGLKVTSYLRVDKLYTLHQSVIAGRIGILPDGLLAHTKGRLRTLLKL